MQDLPQPPAYFKRLLVNFRTALAQGMRQASIRTRENSSELRNRIESMACKAAELTSGTDLVSGRFQEWVVGLMPACDQAPSSTSSGKANTALYKSR